MTDTGLVAFTASETESTTNTVMLKDPQTEGSHALKEALTDAHPGGSPS
jgi:hypothetical protein